jgi:hypothetical protein
VVQRANNQPTEQPNEDDLSGMSDRSDIFIPPGESEVSEFSHESSKRVIAYGLPGTSIGEYETYGVNLTRIAFDNGDTQDVPSEDVETAPEQAFQSVTAIQEFINSIPEPTQHTLKTHSAAWRKVMADCQERITRTPNEDERTQLVQIHSAAERNLKAIGEVTVANAAHDQYVSEQPKYEVRTAPATQALGGTDVGGDGWLVYEAANAETVDTEKLVREGAAIWASELDESLIGESEIVRDAATSHVASVLGRPNPQVAEAFAEVALRHLAKRKPAPTEKTASVELPQVDPDALFM